MDKIDHDHEFDGKQDRNYHQKPFDEGIDPLPQIDEQSAGLADGTLSPEDVPGQDDTEKKHSNESSGNATEINEEDPRDQGDSTQEWDAENNRSSHRK